MVKIQSFECRMDLSGKSLLITVQVFELDSQHLDWMSQLDIVITGVDTIRFILKCGGGCGYGQLEKASNFL